MLSRLCGVIHKKIKTICSKSTRYCVINKPPPVKESIRMKKKVIYNSYRLIGVAFKYTKSLMINEVTVVNMLVTNSLGRIGYT